MFALNNNKERIDVLMLLAYCQMKKEAAGGFTLATSCCFVRVQSVSRVLYLTVIFLDQSLPKGSSEYIETSSKRLISFLAPSGVYMNALSPKRL